MVVGSLSIVLYLHGTQSLKEKRGIVKRILARTRGQFNVSAAEVDDNDLLGRARLAFVTVGNDRRYVNSCLDKILEFVDALHLAEIVDQQIEIVNYS